MTRLLTFCLASLLLLTACPSDRSERDGRRTSAKSCDPEGPLCDPRLEIDVLRDIAYSADEGRHNDLDLYIPRDAAEVPKPLVIFLHPGVFILGDKGDYFVAKVCEDFARCGYAAAAVNYTLLQDIPPVEDALKNLADLENPVKAQLYDAVRDASTAIRFLKGQAANYNIDPNKIFLTGYSAGAVIALNIAFIDNGEEHFYFGRSVTDDANECLACLPTHNGTGNDQNHSVAGVIAINGAVFDHRIIDDDDRTPVLFIHSDNDQVISPGVGRAYGRFANHDRELDLPAIAFELGITRTAKEEEIERIETQGFQPKVLIPRWLPVLANSFVSPEVYGSRAIHNRMGPRCRKQILTLSGGHNFVVDPQTGMFNCAYDQARKAMKDFMESGSAGASRTTDNPRRRRRD
jgi:dienelactone hydrolase